MAHFALPSGQISTAVAHQTVEEIWFFLSGTGEMWRQQTGCPVIFFPMTNGKPGPTEDFLTGFLSSNGANGTPIQQWGRPVGVTVARDGALLVSDDAGNRIWKVSAR
jgi:glucose/arabinose dehydrogenase